MAHSFLQQSWPVLTRYDQSHLTRIALPLGGIGTGTVSLGGRGDLRDWEIVNRPAKGFMPAINRFRCAPFFALWTKTPGRSPVTRLLEGILEAPFEGAMGATAANHGFPRFRQCEFHAAYPFGQVLLGDADVPLSVRIEAFNPLVPGDADRSGIPVAILRYVLINTSSETVDAAVCGSMPNFIGTDGTNGEPRQNVNEFRNEKGLRGVFMSSEGVPVDAEQYGTMALTTTADAEVTHRLTWDSAESWSDALLGFWDDFSEDGRLDVVDGAPMDSPPASLAARAALTPGEERELTFLLTWHFPNRQTWTPAGGAEEECCGGDSSGCDGDADRVGNYYTTQYEDAWEVARSVSSDLETLERDTLTFVTAFCDSDLPSPVKEAALYNLSTLRTQTSFRTEDGRFYGFEGCRDNEGCCLGSCTHVWNYEQATAFLFGELSQSMREVEFAHATDDKGLMSFRTTLPLSRATEHGIAAADGQMGCIMKLYRDWQLSGDNDMLHRLWPIARKALEFCWIKGGWDEDRDGVMEGCQHNTLDVEYYGPNPLMGGWYLGALRAGEEMARYVGDDDFAHTCRDLFERGSAWLDQHLFNGEYYEHQIRRPAADQVIADGLRRHGGPVDTDPPHQVGPGCLVDQLAGEYMAHVCGLGYLLDKNHVHTTLQSIMKHNFKEDLFGHFNHMRTYALNDEQGLVICSYPRGGRPKRPTPYFSELMTGFEYTAAVHMLYEGQVENGLRVIEAIRNRYDGRRRSPFNEAECGHHYSRAMIAWAAVPALTGFRYSGVYRTMTFAAKEGSHFWANGTSWGVCRQVHTTDGIAVELKVLYGDLSLERLVLEGAGEWASTEPVRLASGEMLNVSLDDDSMAG